jgi:hypothetical protein
MADKIYLSAFEEGIVFGGGALLNRSGWAPMPALELMSAGIGPKHWPGGVFAIDIVSP